MATSTNRPTLDQLIERSDTEINEQVREAAASLNDQKEKDKKQRVLRCLEEVRQNTENALTELRSIRKREAAYKIYLNSLSVAEAAFYQNADEREYHQKIQKARTLLDNTLSNNSNRRR